jgi:hypothetical protein
VHGYLEVYGAEAESLSVTYEVAVDEDVPPLIRTDAEGVEGGADRMIFSKTLSVGRLPRGKYLLRAVVTSAGGPVKTMVRPFEIALPLRADDVGRERIVIVGATAASRPLPSRNG